MITREAEATVKELALGYPAVIITGPRQSGKTTLAKSAFPDKAMNLSSMRGPFFENLIVSEMLKTRYNAGRRNNLHFWRDSATLRSLRILADDSSPPAWHPGCAGLHYRYQRLMFVTPTRIERMEESA
jgi:predicted AAA+ superfamily ATPase